MTDAIGKYVAELVLALLIVAPAFGDDLSGAKRLLCASSRVSHRIDDLGCGYGAPKTIDLPEFIEIYISLVER